MESHIIKQINTIISERNGQYGCEDSFFVFDPEVLQAQYNLWKTHLPQVVPYYAVKCNNSKEILSRLLHWGASFDCASQIEMQMVIDIGAKPEQIVYANPVKANSHLRFASENGVRLMTFDNTTELYKIKEIAPKSDLLLRIKTDDSSSICSLSCKFGAAMENVEALLETASQLSLNVVGVSYHIGSGGAISSDAHSAALRNSRETFELGAKFGYNFNVLDIGGGFGSNHQEFIAVTDGFKSNFAALEFPENTKLISEPGRFFAAPVMTLIAQVIGVRQAHHPDEIDMVYLTDGVYGNLNSILYDHQHPKAYLLNTCSSETQTNTDKVSLWGPTCDGIDCIDLEAMFPRRLKIGDWLCFPDCGAYTSVGESTFNGFNTNTKVFVAEH